MTPKNTYIARIQKLRKNILVQISLSGLIMVIFVGIFWQSSPLLGAPSWLWSIIGTYNDASVPGTFDTSGDGGNAGQIIFIDTIDEALLGGSGVYMDTSSLPQTMSGYFFSETLGWIDMNHVELIPPTDMNVMTPWMLSGYIWSDNAGYIAMEAQDPSYSGASYVPGTQAFSGYAWSDNIGYIPFLPSSPTFKNKVKILGSGSRNRTYDTEYNIGNTLTNTTASPIIEQIRKNVALLTRGFPGGLINTSDITTNAVNDILYYKISNGTITNPGTKMENDDIQTLIVEGGDVYIDNDILEDPQVEKPRVIIVLKNAFGSGGNVYIKNSVKNIYSSIIAEGALYSGESASILYNDTASKLTSLPRSQLYIYGSVISRNTIGGSAQTPASCPYTEQNCTYSNSLKYDWNYFRTYDQDPSNASDKTGYDDYSIVIEYDSRISTDPPPGIDE